MARAMGALLVGLLLVQAGAVRAADEAPAGSWKVFLPFQVKPEEKLQPFWLLKLENKDGKWAGTVSTLEGAPDATAENVLVADGVLKFSLKLTKQGLNLAFEGAVPKQGEPILGTVLIKGKANPVPLEKTTLTSLDPYDMAKEELATASGAEGVRTVLGLLEQAAEKKAKPEEVSGWADKAVKWAEPYGPRWQREITLSVAETLGEQAGYGALALPYARQAEHALDAKKDSPGVQRRVLRALAAALKNSDKKDEAKEVEARLEKIPVVVAPPYPGRKGKGDRVALVELFTGAQCPPCVTADVAFDALDKSFQPDAVVFLEYHLNIPGPDPLANKDTEERAKYYGNKIEGTPTMFVGGKLGPPPGGSGEDDSQEVYDAYSTLIQPLLEKPAKARLKATTKFADGKSHVKVEVSDLEEPGDDVKLRLALVEDEVAYTGGNKVPLHHQVVRGFVGEGGAGGAALKEKTGRQVVTIDLEAVRKGLQDYMKASVASEGAYVGKEPSVDLKKLRLVAFVQNDETGEVLQALQVDLPTE